MLQVINKKVLETPKRILEKASELFMRYGIRSISMDDIAKDLAISKKTIYQYFKDKDTLVCAVADAHFEQDKCDFKSIQDNATDALEEMITMSQHIKATFVNINPVAFLDLQKYHPRSWRIFEKYKKEFIIKSLEDNLRRGIKDGLYRDDINVEALAILRVTEVELAFDPDLFPAQRFNFRDLQVQFIEHFMRGIVTPKGFQILEDYKNKQEALQ